MSDVLQDVVHVGDWIEVTYHDSLLIKGYYNKSWEGEVIEIEEDKFWVEQKFGDKRFISRVFKDSDIYRYHIKDRFRSTNSNTNSV